MEDRMHSYISIWCHNKYGGTPVSNVVVDDDSIKFTGGETNVVFYCGVEQEVINLKNMVLQAFNKWAKEREKERGTE
jgi:hypothetical protein